MAEEDVPVIYTPSDVTEDLTAAAMWGDVDLLESLLQNGADPNLPNAQRNTALHVACYYGERECANILLNYKGQYFLKGVFVNIYTTIIKIYITLHCYYQLYYIDYEIIHAPIGIGVLRF